MTGTAGQQRVPKNYFQEAIIGLPPLAEQKRIVEKVDSLMALCDELEDRQASRNKVHLGWTKASLTSLAEAEDAKEFQKAWLHVSENFDTLITTPESVTALRQTILDLAVRGKLVPQDPEDEPASELLKRIDEEKSRLVANKIIRKPKELDPVEMEPYEPPSEWLWSRLGRISNDVHYGYTASANSELLDVRLLRISDIQNDSVNWEHVPGCEIDDKKFAKNSLNNGDLLIARTGGTIGKTYLVENLQLRSVFASYLIRVIPTPLVNCQYLKRFTQSSIYWGQLYAKSVGTGQPNVNATSLKELLLPLPPLEEQMRIVAKVDELMALCDQLEANLSDSRIQAEKLASAVVSISAD